jgi:hypothetical protein
VQTAIGGGALIDIATLEHNEQFCYTHPGMNEQIEFVKVIARRLDSADIPYMLTDSIALSLYGLPRMTRDIDLVVECQTADAVRIADLFQADCYVDGDAVSQAIRTRTLFNVIHSEWITKADFIVRKDDEFRQLEFERRRRFNVDDVPVWVVSAEDLILSKLRWAADTGSEMQKGDVRHAINTIQELDRHYLEQWAEYLGVRGLLDEAKGE